ncbi:hypothetical protein A2715_05390 [Candidatus Woesebacteria bacterium RIFCSPHIGHO2_01_FULL_39_32]|uniref:Uncharacterized protein n=1 Tax=Candidatus Woesebacteria bacterium RIFCSPLOWO2_01_FULL_39_25 TaxID=1802521 RepID=A0A1F8BLP3_9BACT|nr:MAG: hypothetical protein A2715_05390 [Candidatus Woesebacteria bacterium RIFCSPHIGHO2_01_FULL_39_32]OGM38556.1 MAG: hypothetical protein A3F01_04345 [Candidatus Woesebacteria bacterium RIFCSPHIGHO2_12_FULL_38_11]OGM64984.1 MAG: hypothetical protein A2893_05000 [Candidatus Woesebacteria bacterium RIFCSPLOWO2_01_FULL_39_25]
MTLTDGDLNAIKDLVKVTIDEDVTLVRKEDIRHLSTKDDFYNKMDEVMGELKAIREEHAVLSGLNVKVNNHEQRIERIEKKLQIHSSV